MLKEVQFKCFLLPLLILIGLKLTYGSSTDQQMFNFVSDLLLKCEKIISTYHLH